MRISHLFQSIDLNYSEPLAAQLHIYHTIHGLQKRGHEVTLLALQGKRVLFTDDLRVFKSNQLPGNFYGKLGITATPFFRSIESVIRRTQSVLKLPYLALIDSYRMYEACCQNLQGYDLIHERYNLLAVGGALASRRLGIPYFLEVNADVIEQRKFKGAPERGLRLFFATWAARYCFNSAAKIICISSALNHHLNLRWGIDESKLAVLPCAADTEAFGAASVSNGSRRKLGLVDEPVVMWVGGFYDWHDLDSLLESFCMVLNAVPNARLILVGDGPKRRKIEHKVLEKDLQKSVLFTGSIAHESMPEMLAIADVAVAPSPPIDPGKGGTGTPLKLFEYMAAGKAIVATHTIQAADVIQDGYNGLLVEPGNVAAFAGAVEALLKDPSKRNYLSRNARVQAVEQHSWASYTRRLEGIYAGIRS